MNSSPRPSRPFAKIVSHLGGQWNGWHVLQLCRQGQCSCGPHNVTSPIFIRSRSDPLGPVTPAWLGNAPRGKTPTRQLNPYSKRSVLGRNHTPSPRQSRCRPCQGGMFSQAGCRPEHFIVKCSNRTTRAAATPSRGTTGSAHVLDSLDLATPSPEMPRR